MCLDLTDIAMLSVLNGRPSVDPHMVIYATRHLLGFKLDERVARERYNRLRDVLKLVDENRTFPKTVSLNGAGKAAVEEAAATVKAIANFQ